MSFLYLTADWHLAHNGSEERKGVIQFCNRPFKTTDHMDEAIIGNCNQRVKPSDTLIHAGDFCFNGRVGSRIKASEWESKINCKVIFIQGNHDRSNSVKGMLQLAMIELSGYRVLVQHAPPAKVPDGFDFAICGHVHSAWKHLWVDNRLIINVGVDVWNYRPVRADEVVSYYQRELRHHNGKENESSTASN